MSARATLSRASSRCTRTHQPRRLACVPGDILVRIGQKPVAGLALDEMTALVRGAAGTSVEIVVRRGTDPQELTFNVRRAEIRLQFVKQKLLEDDIGYVSLRGFPEPSVVDSIEQDVAKFQEAGVHGLVLDLRGNSGGRIDVGTRLLSDFLPAGTSVYEEIDRGGENSIHFSRAGSQYDLPLVVLVDGGTASMGEIFASAVQEHGAATILGSNTSGERRGRPGLRASRRLGFAGHGVRDPVGWRQAAQ